MPRRFDRRPISTACVVLLIAALAIRTASPAAAQATLYDRLGGQAGVSNIVDRMIALVTTDDRIKADFDNINLDRLKSRIKDQICQISGGPCTYKGKPMDKAHAGLDLTQAKFNALAEDLQTAMGENGVPYWTQNRLMALLAPMQRDIVTR